MKIFKVLMVAMLLLPFATEAQAQARKTAAKPKAKTEAVDKYQLFDCKEAASYWRRWVRKDVFSQEDFARVMDLCIIAYDYLNADISKMLEENTTSAARKRCALDLDTGKTSEMETFVRSFANNLQNLAASGQFSDENVLKVTEMIEKKQEFKRLTHLLCHS